MTIINHSFRLAMGMAIAGALGGTALAQQSITSFLGISYSHNFNTLSTTGVNVSTPLPANWLLSENGSTTAGTYSADNGGNSGVNLYSYGSTGSSDRALGSLRSGSAAENTFGIIFENNTGQTITSLYIGYTGEQWRQGENSTTDRLDFSYSENTSGLFTGSWVNFNALDFSSPNSTSSNDTALDGNAAGNFTPKGSFITVNIPNGQTFGIRWRDSRASDTDDGLAIDDLIVMVPEAWQPAAMAGMGLLGLIVWQRRRSCPVAR
jgi:hypothetical protein